MSNDEHRNENTIFPCVMGIENKKEIDFIKREILSVKEDAKDTRIDIKEIKECLLGRPSWAVTVIIAFLSSITIGSLTFALTAFKYVNGG